MPEQTATPPPQSDIKREEDFASLYANIVNFEVSLWDLKLIFGQLDQREGKPVVEQHTAITIPWTTAKLMSYYLQINLAFHEAENGKIKLPDRVLPPEPGPLPEDLENNPQAKAMAESARKMREEFIADLR